MRATCGDGEREKEGESERTREREQKREEGRRGGGGGGERKIEIAREREDEGGGGNGGGGASLTWSRWDDGWGGVGGGGGFDERSGHCSVEPRLQEPIEGIPRSHASSMKVKPRSRCVCFNHAGSPGTYFFEQSETTCFFQQSETTSDPLISFKFSHSWFYKPALVSLC